MIRHVVLLKWNDKITPQAVENIGVELGKLKDDIEQIRSYEYGPDENLYKGNADYALVAEFASQAELDAYVVHPRHKQFLKEVAGPVLESFMACQFAID